ncbi:MAG: 3-isopropylmalate dehydratase large subunit [Geminicoccaceae bacterium]|nr:3-isopropylmalate dehydratase large subunit [Geminicoccaceae bacterium]
MAETLAQKIVARAAGRSSVEPGELVTCRVDLAMLHDSGGPRRVAPILERLGVGLWDPSRVVLVSDHYVPAVDPESARILDLTRRWGRAHGVARHYDMLGICHVVLAEHGHVRPGMFVVGGDSHTPTAGAFAAFAMGVGASEMAAVLATGEIWLEVPETLRILLDGRPGPGVVAKDVLLALCRMIGLGGAGYRAIEYGGEGLAGFAMEERMTLANMAAELGGITGLVPPDRRTLAWLERAGVSLGEAELTRWRSDPDAPVAATLRLELDRLAPQVAAPHGPANAAPVDEVEPVPIDQAYIGACTGAKLVDLRMAASVLRGRKVAAGTRLLVAPASARVWREAAADGTLATLTEAGAIMLPSGCGACAGYGAGVLAEGEVCIASTARNFKGRMGAPSSRVYLASPLTVAASAVAGRIADPRPLLAERREPEPIGEEAARVG